MQLGELQFCEIYKVIYIYIYNFILIFFFFFFFFFFLNLYSSLLLSKPVLDSILFIFVIKVLTLLFDTGQYLEIIRKIFS